MRKILVISLYQFLLHCTTTAQDKTIPKTDTTIVSVDGHQMYLYVSGTGWPAVIFESGMGATHQAWEAVIGKIARTNRVVAYDRPGYLLSDSCKKRRDGYTIATELKEALRKAGVPPPYVLVGWSLGGALSKIFAGLYPEEVKGIVLVDPAPEKSYPRILNECAAFLAEDSIYIRDLLASNRVGEKKEFLAFDTTMSQAMQADGSLNCPVMLLISPKGKSPGEAINDPQHCINRIWTDELRKWARAKENVQATEVDCGHHIAKERPDVVIGSVRQLLSRLK